MDSFPSLPRYDDATAEALLAGRTPTMGEALGAQVQEGWWGSAFGQVAAAGREVAGERVHSFDLLDPAAFDAVVSGARALVGNDSGPKHLAAARGVPTVSVHVDRLNWNEWGQDGVGAIVSKRVPCTGCGLNDIDLCARDAVCVRSISVDEVFAALRLYL